MNKNNKPLSPHLTIYKPQITSVMSITHRATGVFQSLGTLFILTYFFSVVLNEDLYKIFEYFIESYVGKVFLFFYLLSLCYHLCNGIRHLLWDLGFGFEIKNVYYSGYFTIFIAILLNFIIWFL